MRRLFSGLRIEFLPCRYRGPVNNVASPESVSRWTVGTVNKIGVLQKITPNDARMMLPSARGILQAVHSAWVLRVSPCQIQPYCVNALSGETSLELLSILRSQTFR